MKHKHYSMIVAKAENMELIKFARRDGGDWVVCQDQDGVNSTRMDPSWEYFLCLPQHKEACLHWLNGGDVQDLFEDEWSDCGGANSWEVDHMFMDDEAIYRIKPKKEKRWIAYHKDGFVFDGVSSSKSGIKIAVQEHELSDYIASDWQFKEIEVEV